MARDHYAFSRFVPYRRFLTVKNLIVTAILLVIIVILQLQMKIGVEKGTRRRDNGEEELKPSKDLDNLANRNPQQKVLTQQLASVQSKIESKKHKGDGLMVNSKGFSHLGPKDIILPNPEPIPLITSKENDSTVTCLKYGTSMIVQNGKRCVCRKGWYGKSCNIPDCIQYSDELAEKHQLRVRKELRRVIYAAPFNIEFGMLETIVNELYDLVDVFIFVESPFTAFGTRKPVRLLPKLHRSYLKRFHSKMLYLYMDHFPLGGRKNGWVADSYIRSYLGRHGLPRIHNTRADDLFLVFDLDEIPSRDSIIFLKLHDGYPEPFGFRFRWSMFGFFWKLNRYTQVTNGCTLEMLTYVHKNESNQIRDVHHGLVVNNSPELQTYQENHSVRSWFLGELSHFAGWHCSSCMDIHDIRIKFLSAQNGDFPRWGSFHEKMDLKYIENLVREGKWFDDNNLTDIPMVNMEEDRFFAPPYMLQHFNKYKFLLQSPYLHEHTHLYNAPL